MGSRIKRRYSIANAAEYTVYTETFDRLLLESQVLNAGDQRPNVHTILWDKQNLVRALRELEGDGDDGKYLGTNHVRVYASLTLSKMQLEELEKRFARYCDQREERGYERPTEWPVELLHERLRAEARLDVYLREQESLTHRLKQYENAEQSAAEDRVLQFGLMEQGRLQNGELAEIDFQRVGLVEGLFVITEPSSPYHGMAVKDYRKLCAAWRAERINRIDEMRRKRKRELSEQGFSNTVVPMTLGRMKVNRATLPKWPEGARNYFVKERQEQ